MFNKRHLVFTSPFGSYNTRTTFIGLPQGSCISPIIFNVYMSIIDKHLELNGHNCFIYADDMVIFTSNKSLDLAIAHQNRALKDLKFILDKVSFVAAPEKCKFVIFSKQRYVDVSNIHFDNIIIPYVPNIIYLGITLDAKLRWVPHITSLTATVSRWSNFLGTVTNTWWGSHPSSLLMIYRTFIRSKLDYGCFFYGSASFSNWNNINKLQISCLRSIMGYLRSTPCPVIEVESNCAPFNIRCRWLANKFMLKQLSHSNHTIFDMYYSLFLS